MADADQRRKNSPGARRILADLPVAIAGPGQLKLLYQPRVDFHTRRCVGAEALIRWQHPEFGLLLPDLFIPAVEQSGLSARLTDWVLGEALQQVHGWRSDGFELSIAINMSGLDLEAGYFAGRVIEALSRYEVPPRLLEFEFTERVLYRDSARTRQQLSQLRRAGLTITIDDFGVGYNNLIQLTQVPAQKLKIDRALVSGLEQAPDRQTIVRWVIRLAHELGLGTVAEGIETGSLFDLIGSWGCDEAQGYFISRPLEPADLTKWLHARTSGLAVTGFSPA